MDIKSLEVPLYFKNYYATFPKLTPIQEKAVQAGVLEGKSLVACAPTASGKTFIGSLALIKAIEQGKGILLLPLRALAKEKYMQLKELFKDTKYKVALSSGEKDDTEPYLAQCDIIILTTEKMDALLRHNPAWISQIKTVVIDEIHLLNDASRGPTLEIVLTILKQIVNPQIIGLSATIGNPKKLADWLQAELIKDTWRPVVLQQGIVCKGEQEVYK